VKSKQVTRKGGVDADEVTYTHKSGHLEAHFINELHISDILPCLWFFNIPKKL
jgi:hypothetical protein